MLESSTRVSVRDVAILHVAKEVGRSWLRTRSPTAVSLARLLRAATEDRLALEDVGDREESQTATWQLTLDVAGAITGGRSFLSGNVPRGHRPTGLLTVQRRVLPWALGLRVPDDPPEPTAAKTYAATEAFPAGSLLEHPSYGAG